MPDIFTLVTPDRFWMFLASGLLLNLTPGADVMFATASGLRSGPRVGAAAGLGVGLGGIWHVGLAALGITALLAALPAALVALKWLGAAYLLYLGWRMLMPASAFAIHQPAATGSAGSRRVFIDAMLTKGGVQRYGGWVRFVISAAMELTFSFLQGAVSTIRTSIFMIGLAFGKSVVWGGQSRDATRLSWEDAARNLWPQTLFGIVVCGLLLLIEPAVFTWSLPLTAGYLLAIPFAVVTASPGLGRLMKRLGLCGIPEDFETPSEVRKVLA